MTEEGRQYFNDLIADFYVGSGNHEGCVYIVQQSNILQMKQEDFQKLKLPEGTAGFYHEFYPGEMMGAYEPFLSVIAKMKEKTGMDGEALLRASGACLYHYDIFLGYFKDGVCRRRDWPILTELEYEKTRIMQAMVQMLKILSEQCPIFVLLNNIQVVSTSTFDLLCMLMKENIRQLRVVAIVNQSAKASHYTARSLSNLLAACKERGNVSDWTIEEEEEPLVDPVFYVKPSDEEAYFTKLNNMLQTLAYEQANNYLTYIGQRMESDTVNVTEQFRARYLRYTIISRMFKGNYAMALLSCDSLRKMNSEDGAWENQIFACFHGAVCSLYNGNKEDATRQLEECRRYIENPDEKQEFALDMLELLITLQGFEVSITSHSIPVKEGIPELCEKYGFENYLANVYVYASGNRGTLFATPEGIEERIPEVMKGIHLAEKLGNTQFIMRAYDKNVMIASINGYNNTANYFYDQMLKVANGIQDQMSLGNIYNGLGYNCCSVGNYEEANRYYNKALEIFCSYKDENYLLETLYNMGINDILAGDYGTAIETLGIVNESAQLMKKSELRLCNMTKVHGLIALAATRLGKYHTARLYYNKMKRVLEFFIEGSEEISDFYLWDDDLFFYYFIDAVIKTHEGRYEEALELFQKAKVYMEHSKGSMFVTFYEYTIALSKLYLCMGMEKERRDLFRKAKGFFIAKNNTVCVEKLEELEKTGVWQAKECMLPFLQVSPKEVNKHLRAIMMEKDAEQRIYEMHLLMSIQDIINCSYYSDGIHIKDIIDKFKHSFDVAQVVYLKKEDDGFVEEYSDVKLSLTRQDYVRIEEFFVENSDGFITSQVDNSFLRGEEIVRMFRPLRIFSAIAVPIYNNERLNSIFFALNCVGDSYKVCMRKNRMSLTELDTYRFIFRQIVEANEKHELNEQLKQQVYNAEKANRAKSDFLARMSHEIRTPINAVLGMDELILRESKEDEIRHYASDIRNSANNLLGIINEILDSAKIESGKMEIVCARYQMSDLLNNLYTMIAVKAEQKELELIFEIDRDMPVEYYGDDVRIRQVLVNLLTNAIKYTPSGVVKLSVSAKTKGEKALLYFEVRDTGIGIKHNDINKLFSEFERIDTEKNRYIEGTGLGMNITVQLLKLMGSELHVESKYGEGSVFYFELMQDVMNAEPIGDFRERLTQALEPEQHEKYIAPEAKILVVDDNMMNRKVFKGLLKPTQMQVMEAASGQECLKILEDQKFDMIFLDHMMPVMDGLETFRHMKERNLCEGIPVIMLTANAIIGMREEYLSKGLDDFLTKPIKVDLLDEIILKYLPKELVKKGVTEIKAIPATEEEVVELPEIEGFDFDYAIRMMGSKELLKSTLMDFYQSITYTTQKFRELESQLMTDTGVDSYRIEIHALKGVTATVGAIGLSSLAKLLETAAKEKNLDRIFVLHPVFMEELEKHRQRLKEVFEEKTEDESDGTEEKAEPVNTEEIVQMLGMLSDVLSMGDYGTASIVLYEITKYKYNKEVQFLIDALQAQIREYDSEAAMEGIREIQKRM